MTRREQDERKRLHQRHWYAETEGFRRIKAEPDLLQFSARRHEVEIEPVEVPD